MYQLLITRYHCTSEQSCPRCTSITLQTQSTIPDTLINHVFLLSTANPWSLRFRVIVPALHKRYVANMVNMFADSTLHCADNLDRDRSKPIEMENYFSRLGLDIIGKAVFGYGYGSFLPFLYVY